MSHEKSDLELSVILPVHNEQTGISFFIFYIK